MTSKWHKLLILGIAVIPGCKGKAPAPEDPSAETSTPGKADAYQPKTATSKPALPHRAKIGFGTYTVGKATTFVANPFDDNGHIDYASALNERMSKGVTPEKNAVVMIWKALGPDPVGGKAPPGYFENLGISAPPATGDYFISARAFVDDRLGGGPGSVMKFFEKLGRVSQSPWSAKENPDVAGWLKANQKPLEIVRQATNRSRYHSPVVHTHNERGERNSIFSNPFPSLQPTREIATALMASAMLAIDEGRADAAWQDIIACHRLARLVGSGATMMEGLVGLVFERLASRADLILLQRANLDAKQLQGYLSDLTALPPFPEMTEKADLSERFMCLDGIILLDRYGLGYMERIGGLRETPAELAEAGLKGIDWNPALETVNRWFDRLANALRQPNPQERARMLDQLESDLRTHRVQLADSGKLAEKLTGLEPERGKSQIIGDYMIVTLPIQLARKVQENTDQLQQVLNNSVISYALAWYHHDNGKYPDSLAALAPKYLKAVPRDLFSEKDLIYRPMASGFLLYSVGVNGKDDGGRGAEDQPAGDDLVVRMPSAR